jgi:hypothetical protein
MDYPPENMKNGEKVLSEKFVADTWWLIENELDLNELFAFASVFSLFITLPSIAKCLNITVACRPLTFPCKLLAIKLKCNRNANTSLNLRRPNLDLNPYPITNSNPNPNTNPNKSNNFIQFSAPQTLFSKTLTRY